VCEKGNRNVVHSPVEEQSYKMKVDTIILKVTIIEEKKRRQRKKEE